MAAYNSDVRLEEIGRDGIDAEVLFPTLGMRMFPIEDAEYRRALFRAYNDWLAEDFCRAAPRPVLRHCDDRPGGHGRGGR